MNGTQGHQNGDAAWHREQKGHKTEVEELRQRVAELEAIVESRIDDGIDKIMAMSDDQINALAGFEGHNPDDQERIGKLCMQLALANCQVKEVTKQRDRLLMVIEAAYKTASEHAFNVPFDWAMFIASVKED